MKNPIAAVIEKFRGWSNAQRALLLLLGVGLCLLLLGRGSSRKPQNTASFTVPHTESTPDEFEREVGAPIDDKDLRELQAQAALTRQALKTDLGRSPAAPTANRSSSPNPLIAHTAELAVATKEFARSRGSRAAPRLCGEVAHGRPKERQRAVGNVADSFNRAWGNRERSKDPRRRRT